MIGDIFAAHHGPRVSHWTLLQVIFVVPIGTGVDCLSGLPSIAEDCPSSAQLQSLEQNIKLKVSWSLSASGVSDAVPARQLLLPSQLGHLLGRRIVIVLYTLNSSQRVKGHTVYDCHVMLIVTGFVNSL